MKKKSDGINLNKDSKSDIKTLIRVVSELVLTSKTTSENIKDLKADIAVIKVEMKDFATKDDINDLKSQIRFVPDKDLFLTEMSRVMGELQVIRDSNVILTGKSSEHTDMLENHEERITKLEHVPQASI